MSGSPPGVERETSKGREGREGSEEGRRSGHREKEVDSFCLSSSPPPSSVLLAFGAASEVEGEEEGAKGVVVVFISSAEAFFRRSSGIAGSEEDGELDEVEVEAEANAAGDKAPPPRTLLSFSFSSFVTFLPSPPLKGHDRLANGG